MALPRKNPQLAKVSYLPGHDPAGEAGAASAAPAPAAPTATEQAAARRADRAANVTMNALTRRGMSRWELEQILIARELEPDEIETELDRLAGVGLIDDAALAETIVRTQHERKGLGRSALVAEMRRRHIDPDTIEEALDALGDDSELARALELAHKRAPQLRSLDQTTAKRRLTAFLMRKGYPSSVIRTAVDQALDAAPDAGDSTVRFR
ncbi:MAG: regulatory protein RecX [Burkholderiaceae bacterium]|nr:regulatory protein RecX [Microbacteriaceae bacterium]